MNGQPDMLAQRQGSLDKAGPAPGSELDAVARDDRSQSSGDPGSGSGTTATPLRRVGNRVDTPATQAVRDLLTPGCCLLDVAANRRELLFTEMVDSLRTQSVILDSTMVLSLLLEREKLGSTAIGKGVAIPHARSLAVSSLRVALATSRRGIPWQAPDGEPVRLIFLVLAPSRERARKPYLELIARIAQGTRLARDRRRLLEATTFDEVASAMKSHR
jgi:mannitol/fructose-specific phosphotransferase system IIA component (Ntr-type)